MGKKFWRRFRSFLEIRLTPELFLVLLPNDRRDIIYVGLIISVLFQFEFYD